MCFLYEQLAYFAKRATFQIWQTQFVLELEHIYIEGESVRRQFVELSFHLFVCIALELVVK